MLPVPLPPRSAASWDWLRNATFDALMRAAAVAAIDGHGEMQGVEQWLLLRSHWSRSFRSSSAVGPPEICVAARNKSLSCYACHLYTNMKKLKCCPCALAYHEGIQEHGNKLHTVLISDWAKMSGQHPVTSLFFMGKGWDIWWPGKSLYSSPHIR